MLHRLEQKLVEKMMDHLSRVSKAEELMLNICADNLVNAKVCFQLPKHRRFIGCENDAACVQNELPSLMKIHEKTI